MTSERRTREWLIGLIAIAVALTVVATSCVGQQTPQATQAPPATSAGGATTTSGGPLYVAQQMKDPWYGFASGGVSGAMVVVGIPSLRILKMIPVGVDLHEPVFSGSNAGGTNGTPDGKFVYINDLADNAIGEIDLSTFETVRKIKLPDPFGPHHIAITPS